MSKVKFKKLDPEAIAPSYAKAGDAGMDVYFIGDPTAIHGKFYLYPGQRCLARTGLAIELEPGYEAQVRSKSGRALKEGLVVLNSPGTIDAQYRGEVGVILYNSNLPGHGQPPIILEPKQAIAQLVVKPVEQAEIEIVDDLSATDRGGGGFGSTGLEAKK